MKLPWRKLIEIVGAIRGVHVHNWTDWQVAMGEGDVLPYLWRTCKKCSEAQTQTFR